jgi:DNA-binding response OmpR family regulator
MMLGDPQEESQRMSCAENEALRAEVAGLRAALADSQSDLPGDWRLTATEERIFRVFLALDIATRAAIAEAAGVKAYRTQGVHISRIRAKLKPHRVEIETVHTKGWRLVGRPAWQAVLSHPTAA